jgi:hypothetical protein
MAESGFSDRAPIVEQLQHFDRPQDTEDIAGLLGVLTDRQFTTEVAAANTQAALDSPNAFVNIIRDPYTNTGRIVTMATMNAAPTLRGYDTWIDDVAVAIDMQGRKLSKHIMDTCEAQALQFSSYVSLTSSADRGPARAGYEKRGYELVGDDVIHRKYFGEDEQFAIPNDVQAITSEQDISNADIEKIANLVYVSAEEVETNLRHVIESPTTALFTLRGLGNVIKSISLVNLCPIPVGRKGWVEVDSEADTSKGRLLQAAHAWAAPQYDSLNTISSLPVKGYERRSSGLYVKRLITNN